MLNAVLMIILILAGFGFFAYTMRNKIALLLKAKPDNRFDDLRERINGMIYIAFGQSKMFKDPVPGIMHALIFWGFLILLLRSILLMLSPFGVPTSLPGIVGHFYTLLKEITEAVVALMVIYAAFRRLVLKPERLTQSFEAYLILGLIFILMITDFLYDGSKFAQGKDHSEMKFAPVGALFAGLLQGLTPSLLHALEQGMFWIHMITLFVFLNLLPYSKHFHVITSIPNVFFRKLGPPGALAPIKDIENQETFGVGRVEDFTWKQLLDTYSCTECGRCIVNCPAWQTGKGLNPKFLQVNIREHLKEKAPYILRKAKDGEHMGKSLIEAVREEILWQCTTCRSCEENCPVTITHVDKVIDMRRYLVLMESRFPSELSLTLKNLETKSNPWGLAAGARADWTEGQKIKRFDRGETAEFLFFVGCAGCYDDRNKKIAKAFANIMNSGGFDFAILGVEEGCCGDPARRAGNEYLFQIQAQANIEVFRNYGIRKVVTACPHCYNAIKNEYPQFGGEFEVSHHTEVIKILIEQGRIKPVKPIEARVVFHDSCYLGRYNNIYEAPRSILESVRGLELVEIDRAYENGFCCGAGGALIFMEEHIGTRMNQQRVKQALEKRPSLLASACPFCMIMLRDGINEIGAENSLKAKDIAEIIQDAIT